MDIPVLAVTASAMQGDREKALAAGFNGYLAKPVALASLREEINRLLANSK
jgi:CheY-like chemotaxis protein